MRRARNFGLFGENEVAASYEYLWKSTEDAIAANRRKAQFVFGAEMGGRPCIVKQYRHRTIQHRVGSLLNRDNGDRYAEIALFLRERGLPVPGPLLILKAGRGILPDRTLYVMERLNGRMLLDILPEVEVNRARTEVLSEKVAVLIRGLRQACVVHRDLNTKNFLVTECNEVTLIDFDAASRHRCSGRSFHHRHQRDVVNFLSTCHNAPRFAAAVAVRLNRNEKLSV